MPSVIPAVVRWFADLLGVSPPSTGLAEAVVLAGVVLGVFYSVLFFILAAIIATLL